MGPTIGYLHLLFQLTDSQINHNILKLAKGTITILTFFADTKLLGRTVLHLRRICMITNLPVV